MLRRKYVTQPVLDCVEEVPPHCQLISSRTQPALSLCVSRWRELVQSVHWPSSVQAAFHLVFSTTHVPSADGLPNVVVGRMPRTPLVPPPPGLLPPPPGVNAIAQPFHWLCGCMASGRASYPPVVRSMAFSLRAVALPPSPPPPPPTTFCGLCLRHDLGTVALVAV